MSPKEGRERIGETLRDRKELGGRVRFSAGRGGERINDGPPLVFLRGKRPNAGCMGSTKRHFKASAGDEWSRSTALKRAYGRGEDPGSRGGKISRGNVSSLSRGARR